MSLFVRLCGVFGAQSSAPDPVLGMVILVIAQLIQAEMVMSIEDLLDDWIASSRD